MGAEDILKIAGDTRKVFLEEARNRFGDSTRPDEKGNENPEVADNTMLAEEVLATPIVDAAKNIVPEVVSQEPPVVMPISVKNSVDVATVNNKHAQDRIIKKQKEEEQKKEQITKSEAVGGAESIDKAKGADASAKPEQVKDPLEEAIKTARQQYAQTEFRYQEKMRKLDKDSGFKLFKMGKRYAEGPDTRTARETYEAVLKTKMQKQISELEAKNDNGELDDKKLQAELKELFTYYNLKAAHDLYNARTEEIIAFKKEDSPEKSALRKGWDKVSLGMTSIAHAYNTKVPLWVKGVMLAGGIATGTGLVAASTGTIVFSSTKRIWGAIMMATTGGMQLDAAAQFMDKWQSGKKSAKNIKEVTTKEGKIDFDKFKGMLNGEIESVDKKLNKYVKRSNVNKYVAVGMALVFGSLAFSSWAHALPNNGAEHSVNPMGSKLPINGSGQTTDVAGAKLPEIPRTGIFADGGVNHGAPESGQNLQSGAGKGWSTNAFEHAKETGIVPVSTPTEKITISVPHKIGDGPMRHDSFIRSLRDHIKGHPGIDNADASHVAEVTFADAAKEYANNHNMSYDQAVAKLSRIHPGTTYDITWDSNGHPHMHIDDENIKFMKGIGHGHHSTGGHVGNHELIAHNDMPKPTPSISGVSESSVGTADTMPYNPEHDYQKIETEMGVEKAIGQANENYAAAADDALMRPAGDGPSIEQYEKMGSADNARKNLAQALSSMRAEDAPWLNTSEIGALLEKGAGTKQILGSCLNKITEGNPDKIAFWNEIKNKPFGQVEFGNNSRGVAKVIVEFQKAVGEKYADQIYPKKDLVGNMTEKTGEWLARITKLALQVKK